MRDLETKKKKLREKDTQKEGRGMFVVGLHASYRGKTLTFSPEGVIC